METSNKKYGGPVSKLQQIPQIVLDFVRKMEPTTILIGFGLFLLASGGLGGLSCAQASRNQALLEANVKVLAAVQEKDAELAKLDAELAVLRQSKSELEAGLFAAETERLRAQDALQTLRRQALGPYRPKAPRTLSQSRQALQETSW